MSLDRQDRIGRYVRDKAPEGEMQAFEWDLEKDDFLSHRCEETLLVAESIRDVVADRGLMEVFRMTSEEEVEMLTKEKHFGRRFLNRVSRVTAATLLVAAVTWILLLPPSKSMEGLYLMYYEPVGYETLVPRGSVSDEPDRLLQEAFVEYKKGSYIAASCGFEPASTLTKEISFFSVICYSELDNPESVIARLLPLVEMGDKCLYFQPAEWYLPVAYLKDHRKENALFSLKRIAKTDGFYAEKTKAILDKLEERERPLNRRTFYG